MCIRDSCKVVAGRKPQDYWRIVEGANLGDHHFKDDVKKNQALFERYDKWFRRNFGRQSEPVTIGANQVSHVLVGSMPPDLDLRLSYQGFAGAKVRLSRADKVFFAASAGDYDKVQEELVINKAKEVLGHDLSELNKTQ